MGGDRSAYSHRRASDEAAGTAPAADTIVATEVHEQRFSCRSEQCGMCMVRMDDKWMKSCITPARWAIGKEVPTQGELIRIKQEERARAEAEATRLDAAKGAVDDAADGSQDNPVTS